MANAGLIAQLLHIFKFARGNCFSDTKNIIIILPIWMRNAFFYRQDITGKSALFGYTHTLDDANTEIYVCIQREWHIFQNSFSRWMLCVLFAVLVTNLLSAFDDKRLCLMPVYVPIGFSTTLLPKYLLYIYIFFIYASNFIVPFLSCFTHSCEHNLYIPIIFRYV